MAGKYATNTAVSTEKSRLEIEKIIRRYGATDFASGFQGDTAFIVFTLRQIRVKFVVNLPKYDDFAVTPSGKWYRTEKAQNDAFEQATRQIWRALGLCIKAKLESIEAGIATFEQEFLSYIVTPSGQTVGEIMMPQLDKILTEGTLPKLLN